MGVDKVAELLRRPAVASAAEHLIGELQGQRLAAGILHQAGHAPRVSAPPRTEMPPRQPEQVSSQFDSLLAERLGDQGLALHASKPALNRFQRHSVGYAYAISAA